MGSYFGYKVPLVALLIFIIHPKEKIDFRTDLDTFKTEIMFSFIVVNLKQIQIAYK